ncbi:ATP-binding protein [Methanosarcina sp. KYL-1]|uniref:ATP-binding protein n=1 Tax=Methanosarcina sp. KYL-1 TaxID=2602068 RepID=UPI0021015CBB|nr:ATP-binding protein [Methanosarcina sp. KYL-1]MCQ1537226.1 ATP-binding protein [Methanosarcina sp. KYL-1]
MEKSQLRQVIVDQQDSFRKGEELVFRDVELERYLKGDEIVIISGIRRCGKSSLLKLIAGQLEGVKFYVDFDDIRLSDFEVRNYQDLQDLVIELYGKEMEKSETEQVYYFFDEIQNVPLWERWLNNLYKEGKKVFATGSNSQLLSSEISTFLTGRNKVLKLFPFSFREFLRLKGTGITEEELRSGLLTSSQKAVLFRNFLEYFENGGFPLVLKSGDLELSRGYFEDILNKDILVRYNIKEVGALKDLILFLLSNVGRVYSYSTLRSISGIKSLSTIKNYLDYFQNVFLLYQLPRFDYSLKKQKISPSKVYAIDNSFLKTVAFNFSENKGQRLENLVFVELARREKEVYYHSGKKECDFVLREGLRISEAIQVSVDLSTPETKKREIEGIKEAITAYKLDYGLILTLEEEDVLEVEGKKILIKPVWKWLLE